MTTTQEIKDRDIAQDIQDGRRCPKCQGRISAAVFVGSADWVCPCGERISVPVRTMNLYRMELTKGEIRSTVQSAIREGIRDSYTHLLLDELKRLHETRFEWDKAGNLKLTIQFDAGSLGQPGLWQGTVCMGLEKTILKAMKERKPEDLVAYQNPDAM